MIRSVPDYFCTLMFPNQYGWTTRFEMSCWGLMHEGRDVEHRFPESDVRRVRAVGENINRGFHTDDAASKF